MSLLGKPSQGPLYIRNVQMSLAKPACQSVVRPSLSLSLAAHLRPIRVRDVGAEAVGRDGLEREPVGAASHLRAGGGGRLDILHLDAGQPAGHEPRRQLGLGVLAGRRAQAHLRRGEAAGGEGVVANALNRDLFH